MAYLLLDLYLAHNAVALLFYAQQRGIQKVTITWRISFVTSKRLLRERLIILRNIDTIVENEHNRNSETHKVCRLYRNPNKPRELKNSLSSYNRSSRASRKTRYLKDYNYMALHKFITFRTNQSLCLGALDFLHGTELM